jgi:hypothetical protein
MREERRPNKLRPLLAHLGGVSSRRAKPGSAAASTRRRHGALRARITHTVPSGPAPPAGRQEREGHE